MTNLPTSKTWPYWLQELKNLKKENKELKNKIASMEKTLAFRKETVRLLAIDLDECKRIRQAFANENRKAWNES